MNTEIFNASSSEDIAKAAEILKRGGLLAFPTETVFGLGADMNNESAVKAIYKVKERSFSKPLTLHLSSFEAALPFVKNIPGEVYALAERFLPGPLTIILEKTASVPDYVTGGLRKVGIRVPSNDIFKSLSEAFGGPIAATSANKSGALSSLSLEQTTASLAGLIDGVLSGEDDIFGIESTVLDLSSKPFRVLRNGFVSIDEITETLGMRPLLSDDGSLSGIIKLASKLNVIIVEGERVKTLKRLKSLYEHYSALYDGKVGLILTEGSEEQIGFFPNTKFMGSRNEPDLIASGFFACLKAFEKAGAEVVLVEGIDRSGRGWAVMDRLCSFASEVIQDSSAFE